MDSKTIGVLIPTRDFVNAGFAYDLARLVGFTVGTSHHKVVLYTSSGTLLSAQRQDLAKSAIEAGCTHTMWLDSDMRFPKDTIIRLLKHDIGIVCANYAKRRFPTEPIAVRKNGKDEDAKTIQRVYTEDHSTGLVDVDYCGMGVMLVKAEVYKTMEYPWFAIPWVPNAQDYMGEDVWFCRRAAENGTKTYIDQDLSKEVHHIGSFEFKHEHTIACRDVENGT
jgi:GT2 family glycosyltransferase